MAWLIISLSMMGKFFITASFSLMWIYCCEAYPTCIRNQGLLLTSVAARVASVIASYVGLLVSERPNPRPGGLSRKGATKAAPLRLRPQGLPNPHNAIYIETTYM